jgi:ribose transport system substrate-binding protein
MNKRVASLALSGVLAASVAVPAMAADIDLEAATVGPNGEASTSVGDLPVLTDEELAQIKDGGYKAALMWAGAGTWYNALTKGASERFEELGIEIVAESEADFDPARQQTDIETTMALKPDIILSLPVDPVAGTAAFRPAADAGTVIVFVDNGVDNFVPGEDYASIVTGDHFEMGKKAAELMSDAIGGEGQIGFIFHDAVYYVTNNRDDYARAAFEQLYPDIEIVAEQGFADEASTYEIAQAMLIQNPDLDGIYVAWSAAAQGAISALREAGKDDVAVVAYDLDATNDLDMAMCGNYYGASLDWPYAEGIAMADLAAASLLGKEVPAFVTVDVQSMTRDNLAETWSTNVGVDVSEQIAEALAEDCQ